MAITVTWDDGVNSPSTYTVSADVLVSLDSFRQTITAFVDGLMVPKYPTIQSMIVGVFVEQVVLPALQRFPTPEVQAAQDALDAAQAALAAAQAAAAGLG